MKTSPATQRWQVRNLPYILVSLSLSLLLLGLTLAAVRATSPPEPPVLLRLQAGSFDPLRESPPMPAHLVAVPSPPSPYAIVQFSGPVRPAYRSALERAGIRVLDYLPDYAYVVRLPGKDTSALARLPGARWTGELLPAYRLSPDLWEAGGPLTLTLQLFPGESPAAVTQIAGVQVLEQASTHWQTTLRITADSSTLPALAALPTVRWIEPFVPPQLANDVALSLTGVTTAWTTLGLTGTGQTIAVADTGLDVGASGPITDFAGRIVTAHCIGRPSPCEWDDPNGHGTHVAGSALGSGALSGGQFAGAAPGAGLVIQSLYSPTLSPHFYVPTDLNLLFGPAYTAGARIHNNSWGSPGNLYDTKAQTADQFVWDHPDMLIVAAVGNGGIDRGADGLVDPGSLYSPATAKNVLAVGATESLRAGQAYTGTYGEQDGTSFPANPTRDDTISDAPWGLAAFSSRGPASDGRARPDLVAPGTNIISARSHHPSAAYPYTHSDHYAFYSGSSQAAPLASGAAALAREWYAAQGVVSPSAALLRATLIHGADDLVPGQYGPAVTGTLVISDDVEGSGVWTSTMWIVTDTYGAHSPNYAWAATGTLGIKWLDGTLNLSGTVSPTLFFWNRRILGGSTAKVWTCGSQRVLYDKTNGPRVGWALEAVDASNCAGEENAVIYFDFQCMSGCGPSSPDVWALDDIVVAEGARLAEIGPPPDAGQGWGRLDLVGSLMVNAPSQRWHADETGGLQTGQSAVYLLRVVTDTVPLRVTLVWSDYPASPAATSALVNDLDLELEEPGGAILYPNGQAEADRVNNVEQVEALAPVTGTYRLVVRGHNVPFGPQPYSLVVTLGGEVLSQRIYLPLVVQQRP